MRTLSWVERCRRSAGCHADRGGGVGLGWIGCHRANFVDHRSVGGREGVHVRSSSICPAAIPGIAADVPRRRPRGIGQLAAERRRRRQPRARPVGSVVPGRRGYQPRTASGVRGARGIVTARRDRAAVFMASLLMCRGRCTWNGYTRRDGTEVKAHTRSSPRRRRRNCSRTPDLDTQPHSPRVAPALHQYGVAEFRATTTSSASVNAALSAARLQISVSRLGDQQQEPEQRRRRRFRDLLDEPVDGDDAAAQLGRRAARHQALLQRRDEPVAEPEHEHRHCHEPQRRDRARARRATARSRRRRAPAAARPPRGHRCGRR